MNWLPWFELWFAVAVLLFIILFHTVALIAFGKAFYSSPRRKEDVHATPEGEQYDLCREKTVAMIDEMEAIPYERVQTTSVDGLTLSAKYYHVKDGAPLQIQFHGWRGMGVRDFSGGCKFALECGHNVLLVDQRAHGESGGKVITFGVREKYDVLSWIEYATERFGKDVRICLAGISMGAATVLNATEFDLPDAVKAIVADCPFSSPEEILREVCKKRKLPPKIMLPMFKFGAMFYGGVKIEGGAEKAVANCKVPVLIIHGGDDRRVPVWMAEKIYDACASEKYLFIVPGAGHGLSFLADEEGYKAQVSAFLDKVHLTA